MGVLVRGRSMSFVQLVHGRSFLLVFVVVFLRSNFFLLNFFFFYSRAIMSYLVNKHGGNDRLYPADPEKRALIDRMLYFDIGTLYKAMIDYFVSSYCSYSYLSIVRRRISLARGPPLCSYSYLTVRRVL